MNPPNILFILDDQHRYDALESWGRFNLKTPNLSRLAAAGITHRHAYTPAPLCMPARCCLHTGLYAHQHGMVRNRGYWNLDLPMLPRQLQKAGYHTALVGKLHAFEAVPCKLDLTQPTVRDAVQRMGYDDLLEVSGKQLAWHVGCDWTAHLQKHGQLQAYRRDQPSRQQRDGYAFTLPEEHYIDTYIGDHAVRWLDDYQGEKPFYLCASFCSPHPPYDAPGSWLEQVPDQPEPIDGDAEAWAEKRRNYMAMIQLLDAQVGRLLEALDRKGVLENTLIVFASDHGEMLGEHDLDGKCYPHDPSVRVPMIASWPGRIQPGTGSDALVELTDLPATFLHAATGRDAVDEHLPASPGLSLIHHWQNPATPAHRFVYAEDDGQFFPAFQMVRDHQHKYIWYRDREAESLFDLQADPDERCDLADDPEMAGTLAKLRRRLLEHIVRTPAPAPRNPGLD